MRAGRCDYLIDGRPLFADNGHLAQAELGRFRETFEAVLPAPPGGTESEDGNQYPEIADMDGRDAHGYTAGLCGGRRNPFP